MDVLFYGWFFFQLYPIITSWEIKNKFNNLLYSYAFIFQKIPALLNKSIDNCN